MTGMNMMKMSKKLFLLALLISSSLFGNVYAAEENAFANKIESIDFSALAGGRVSIRVHLNEALANPPASFTLNNPARIALDFPQIGNGLAKSNIPSEQGALKSVSLAQAKDRTRMVLNLSRNVSYNTVLNGKDVIITLQGNEASAANVTTETKFAESRATSNQEHSISNVDFARGKNGEGRIIVDLSDANTGINIKQKGKQIVVDFANTDVPTELQRRLNVINFNTPVLYVDTMKQGKNGRMIIEPKGEWEQSAYQADKKFIIDVRQTVEDPNKLVKGNKPGYAGEKLSLNFQNIEVRSVLQVIADFTGLNIITSDTVTGNITLRLKDVPWDQAMDIIMQNKGLAMRKIGNVITVAPAEEVAAKEKAQLEASNAIAGLAPVHTEAFTLKYTKADDLKKLLEGARSSGGGQDQSQSSGILSKRGSIVSEARTNTVFIQDTDKSLEQIQAFINKIDVPVRQVMIESRLVLADNEFAKELGARFGVQHAAKSDGGKNVLSVGGTLSNGVNSGIGTGAATINGNTGLNSNLPVSNAFGSIAFSLLRLPAGLLLNLELSALESDKRGKIVSSPRVTTANQQKAKIAQGVEIPYTVTTANTSTTTFKKAELSLEVTPQITPDEKIIMDLFVSKDSQGQTTSNGPVINTQNVQTQVLVANGETAVLGGIYQETQRNDVDKVPFFGDLPIVGNAFKHRTKIEDRTELLIFVTPKIMDESLGLR
jgi:type IV pilus assembly protein PilQ